MNRRRWLAALVMGALATVGGLGYAAGRVQSPQQAVADAAPPPASLITAQVTTGGLADDITTRGELVDRSTDEIVAGPMAGMTVTGLPSSDAEPIVEGAVLAELNGRPLLAIQGEFDLYRDLVGGVQGPDVELVQRALGRLGHEVRVDGEYGPSTQAAWKRVLAKRGYQPVAGASDHESQRRAANEAIEQAELALAQLLDPQPAAPGDPDPPAPPASEVAAAKRAVASAKAARDEVYLTTGPMIPVSEVAVVPSLPRTIGETAIAVGQTVPEAQTLFTFEAGGGGVLVDLPKEVADSLGTATSATAELGDGTTVELTVSDNATSPDQAGAEERRAVLFVPVDDDTELPGPDDGTVLVTVHLAEDDTPGLIVPTTALWTTPSGQTAVTVVTAEQASEPSSPRPGRDVMVEVDATLGGFARVAAPADELAEGMLVVVAPDRDDD